jgi:taurine dioxygenase
METRSIEPFGAEITGCRISALTDHEVEGLLDVLVRRRVLVLRDQTGGDEDLVRFLALLGDLTFTDGETPVEGAPDLNLVSNVGRSTPPRSVFHTDTSYVSKPPAFSALRAVTLPEAGGATLFSDQVSVAGGLPAPAREWLIGRTLLHAAKGPDGSVRSARHPVLRRHPTTGETALYLSTPDRCTGLSGVDEATSARIVSALYRRSIRTAGLYRHEWREGDIVLWDDRTTMHRADHGAVVGDRVLHRGLVLGEVPIPA